MGGVILLFSAMGIAWERASAEDLRVVLRPGDEIEVSLSLEKKKLEGAKSTKGTRIPATVQKPFFVSGCEILKSGAAAVVEIPDASAPVKEGKPGYIDFRLVEATFADGVSRTLPGGALRVTGEDRSDRGKVLFVLPRKGGKVEIARGDRLTLTLVGKPVPADKPDAPAPPEPPPFVFYLPASACASTGG
jgi:hypothetical protein